MFLWWSLGICRQGKLWSACVSAQSDQGLLCSLTESMDTTECMNGEQRPGWYFAHVQDDLNLHILRMFEGTFWLNDAHMVVFNLKGLMYYWKGKAAERHGLCIWWCGILLQQNKATYCRTVSKAIIRILITVWICIFGISFCLNKNRRKKKCNFQQFKHV